MSTYFIIKPNKYKIVRNINTNFCSIVKKKFYWNLFYRSARSFVTLALLYIKPQYYWDNT